MTTSALTAKADEVTPHTRVLHAHTLRPGFGLEDTSRFMDDIWDLTPACHKLHERSLTLHFGTLPVCYRHTAKMLCYAVLSGPLPPGETRPKIATVRSLFTALKGFLQWLDRHGGPPIGALTGGDLEAYQKYLLKEHPKSASARQDGRRAARHFWRFRTALGEEALSFDPRHLDDWGESREASAENVTARIPEEVHGPLLAWALKFIDDFSTDILTADATWRAARRPLPAKEWALRHGRPVRQAVEELIAQHIAENRPLPGHRGRPNRLQIAIQMGCTVGAVWFARGMLDEAATIVGVDDRTAMATPITASIDGKPWLTCISTYQEHDDSMFQLARLLQIACYIVIAFLSGMRDSEVKHLQRGCLSIERDSSGTPYRWNVHSLAFKGEDDPTGVPATWLVGQPVSRAVQVLERLQPAERTLLFTRLDHGPGSKKDSAERALTNDGTNIQLNDFISWVNRYCNKRGLAGSIPDVAGKSWRLKTSQFRRTLAWFIARRPGGTIAGALQYRHHSIQMFEGYAGTSDSGFRAEVESEQALTRGEHLMATVEAHEHTKLGGPAAAEAAERLKDFAERARFGGKVVLDSRRLQRIMAKHDPAVYPGEYITCVHDHTKALCEKARTDRGEGLPDHGGCKPLACRNVALTSSNADAWKRELGDIEAQLGNRTALPPLLHHRLAARHAEISRFLNQNMPAAE